MMSNRLETMYSILGAGETREARKAKETRNARAKSELPDHKKQELDTIATDLKNKIAFAMLLPIRKQGLNQESIKSMLRSRFPKKDSSTLHYPHSNIESEFEAFDILPTKEQIQLNRKRVLIRNKNAFDEMFSPASSTANEQQRKNLKEVEEIIENWRDNEGYFLMMISHDEEQARKINGDEELKISNKDASVALDVIQPDPFLDLDMRYEFKKRPNFLGIRVTIEGAKPTTPDLKKVSREILEPHTYSGFKPALSR